ncbi:MAG: hypothetical protein Kow00127_05170 [Bacteroidales bacterium]
MAATQPGQSQTDDWTIVGTWSIPGKASGLASDGTYIYFGIYGSNGDKVYRFDPQSGQSEELFTNPSINDTYGMTYDGTHLWITDHGLSSSQPAYAMELDFSGNIISQFDLPDHYMSGIAWDNGDFWVATYYPNPGTIYKVDNTGAVLTSFQSPDEQPWDVAVEGDDLWVADYDGNTLYKIDQSGVILESHPCENIKPAGVVFDGQYLWYVDGPLSSPSTLYKVDLSGAGTPAINVPVTSYDYGVVAVGDSAVWNCFVSNTGTAPLELTNLVIQNAVPVFHWETFPITLDPGGSYTLEIIYKPTETGALNTIATLQSNDPVNPEVELELTGEAVFNGPHIEVPVTSHDYGTIRLNANTRWFAQIANTGNQTLTINDIEISDPSFYLDPEVSLPLTIPVLETADVGFWFHPQDEQSYSATATITHNDPGQDPVEITLSGAAAAGTYPMGDIFWNYTINTSWDNSIKAIVPLQDINGDGVGEVVTGSEDDFIRCFNGNSFGTADILWEIEAGTVYGQNGLLAVPDLNGDGIEDIVAGLAWGVRAVKAISGKTGEQLWEFSTMIYGSGGWIYQVDARKDFNNDSIPDILASSGNDGNNTGPKRVFCLDGTSGLVIWESFTDGPNFSVIATDDFTGDGIPDAVAGSSTNDETQGRIYGIDGSNGAIVWSIIPNGTSVWALEQLNDINSDGVSDIFAGDFSGSYYFIDPVPGITINTGSLGNALILRAELLDDVNGNGFDDISMASSSSNALVIDGKTGSTVWFTSLADKVWNIDRIGDVSGDGINDLVAGTLFSSNYIYFLNGVNGEILYSANYNEALDGIGAIPDINGDGSWELVAGGRNGKLTCFSGGPDAVTLLADFTADIVTGPVPLEVHFTDLSTGDITEWQWDFENDGIVDSWEQNPVHTYDEPGLYSVSLTVGNGTASNTLVKEDYIEVIDTISLVLPGSQTRLQAYPNPFNHSVVITLPESVTESDRVEITDSYGKVLRRMKPQMAENGLSVTWNGTDKTGRKMNPGVYLVRIPGTKLKPLKIILN